MNVEFNYDKNGLYLVACSGGPDSMALLDMLYKQNYHLIVALVNYKKRAESDEEKEMVNNYCNQRNISFYSTDFNVDYSKKSFQAVARDFRYSFFKELYFKFNCSGLFVGHQKDDLIETYLLKLRRHVTNLSYLIEEKTIIKDMIVYRPLLHVYKDELVKYCKENNVDYGIDSSNLLPVYPRNSIRIELKNKDKEKIYKEALKKDKVLKDKQNEVLEFLNTHNQPYNINDLKDKDNLFLRYFLYFAVDKKYKQAINNHSLFNLLSLLRFDKPNVMHNIEENYYMVRSYSNLTFEFCFNDVEYCYELSEIKELDTPYFKIANAGLKMQGICLFESDFPIKIRNIKNGDKIDIKDGHKKINRLLIDKKIPLARRKTMPVIENAKGKIIFVSGIYRYFERKTMQNNFFVLEYKK